MPLDAGQRLGPYEIVEPLGAGGMGEVYRARDPRLGRHVAVKVLPGDAAHDPDRLARFEREARAIAALSHPNVLAIFDVGTGAMPFLVTELLEGETLRAILARGPLTVPRTVDLGVQLAAGLAAAHDRGVVHRDLKPENLFVTRDGRLKILDFGLARQSAPVVGGDAETRMESVAGLIVGTIGYMSPEQVRGLPVDHRADLFAAGAVLYEMLTGRRAFRGGSPADTISAILNDPPAALVFPTEAPPALAHLVRRCLEKDPARRFESARELATALESVSDLRPGPLVVSPSAPAPSIAVLPFVNLSADADQQYFSEGLAEDLVNALARLPGLRVASRTSSFRFGGRPGDVREIGRELGVGTILEGSVRRAGTRLRITVQLTNTEDGYHIWSQRYDREMADVFEVQDEIVASIVEALGATLVAASPRRPRRPTDNLQAYDLYLKGRYYWNQRSPTVFPLAIKHFEEAIALDPEFALAYSGLADCYSILRVYGWTPVEHTRPRAAEAVARALALEPDLPEARFSKALYTFYFDQHWRAARVDFEEALRATPESATFEAYYGLFLATEYRYAEARRHLERALDLDPHSSLIHFLAACSACTMGDAEGAVRHASRALALQPDALGPRWPQTVGLLMAGRNDEALAAGEQVIARTRAPIYIGVLGMVYGRLGRMADARALVTELREREGRGEYIVPAAWLSLALGLEDLPRVREALAGCVDGAVAPFSVVSTSRWLLDPLRTDAEIDALLDRLLDGAKPTASPL